MFDYTSNSNKSKTTQETQRTKRKSVVTKKGVIKEKTGFGRIIDRFIPTSLDNIGNHIFEEYVVPAIGNTLVDTISYIFDLKRGSSKGTYSGASYRNYYESGSRSGRNKDRDRDDDVETNDPVHKYRNITFDFRQDAMAVLDEMQTILDQYPSVSVADLYDIAGITNNNYTANKYGWTSLERADVKHARGGGYRLVLPRAIPLD